MLCDETCFCFCSVSYVAYDGDNGGHCVEGGYQHAHLYHGYGHYAECDGQHCHALMHYSW